VVKIPEYCDRIFFVVSFLMNFCGQNEFKSFVIEIK